MQQLVNLRQQSPLLALLQQRDPSYHPIVAIHDIAKSADMLEDKEALRLQFDCHKTILRYVEPELKSVDVRVEEKPEDNMVRVSLFSDLDAEFEEVTSEALTLLD